MTFSYSSKEVPLESWSPFLYFQEGAIALVDSYDIFMFVNKTDTEHTNKTKKTTSL